MIMAGGAGGRMGPLTQVRSKPDMPYAGVYRLIDFPLSNCMHSGLSDVWIVEQYEPHSLNEHVGGGRPWDLDRTYGGLQVLPPFQGGDESGWHQGNADAIYRNRGLIRDFGADILLVMSADHIYKLDYREAIGAHRERAADVTMVTTGVPREEAGRFGVVEADDEGRVTGFAYKPDEPKTGVVTTEVFVYDAPKLLKTLEELAAENGDGEGSGLSDFGNELIPRLVEGGRAYEHRFSGYWMDVGTPDSYWQSHMDLLADEPPLELDEPGWPIRTRGGQRPPARIHGSARIENALISPGCTVRGRVVRSVLASGVVVEEGATVEDSIVLHDAVIRSGATVARAIVDVRTTIGARATVGAPSRDGDTPPLTVIGSAAEIAGGARIEPGEQVDPGAQV